LKERGKLKERLAKREKEPREKEMERINSTD
jgi:hypothetical protein